MNPEQLQSILDLIRILNDVSGIKFDTDIEIREHDGERIGQITNKAGSHHFYPEGQSYQGY